MADQPQSLLPAPPLTTPYTDPNTGLLAWEWQQWFTAHRDATIALYGVMGVDVLTSSQTLNIQQNIIISTAVGAVTYTLPDPLTVFMQQKSRVYFIKNNGSATVTVSAGTTTLDAGQSSVAIGLNGSKMFITDGVIWYSFMIDAGSNSLPGFPFNGLLGDGRDGAGNITVPTTASKIVWQFTNLTISSTWTALAGNPSGLFIAVQGRLTITPTGIIDCDGLGGSGAAVNAGVTNIGKASAAGLGFGGTGGGSGDASGAGAALGTRSAPTFQLPLYATGLNWLNVQSTTPYESNAAAATIGSLTNGVNTIVSRSGAAGTNGNSPDSVFPGTNYLDFLLAMYPNLLVGFGSGGASGGTGGAGGTGGTGGNGGGFVFIVCDEFDFQAGAIIRARGTAGTNATGGNVGNGNGGAGGGGGGCIVVLRQTLIADLGTRTVTGGAAGVHSPGGSIATDGGIGGAGTAMIRPLP